MSKGKWKRGGDDIVQDVVVDKIDTSEGGLALTPAQVMKADQAVVFEVAEEEAEYIEPTVDSNIPIDPSVTPAAAMIAIGRLYNDAGVISAALTHHLPRVANQPELFSFLQRMQIHLGEFRHGVEQVEQGSSEGLLDAIERAVA